MPCTKCENGKYKWGKTGECKYDSKEECEKANPKKYSKMKPTPLGKKSYEEYEKELKEFNLSKVERVELAIIDDINKPLDKAMSDFGNIEVGLFKAEDTAVAAVGNYEKAAREAAKGVKAAKELGVSSDIVKLFSTRLNEAEMGAKDASNIAKQIQKIISKL